MASYTPFSTQSIRRLDLSHDGTSTLMCMPEVQRFVCVWGGGYARGVRIVWWLLGVFSGLERAEAGGCGCWRSLAKCTCVHAWAVICQYCVRAGLTLQVLHVNALEAAVREEAAQVRHVEDRLQSTMGITHRRRLHVSSSRQAKPSSF